MQALTTKIFIEKSIKIHGDKYSYDKVIYKRNDINVLIFCKIHGYFLIKPRNHINGHKGGCKKCSLIKRGSKRKSNTEDFIKKSVKIHGSLYDYSNVNYTSIWKSVSISCNKHGVFLQKPHDHLRGAGCQKCGGSEPLTTDFFIKKASKIHNHIYDYSKVNYINARTPVEVVCKKHGSFYPTADNHINKGKGCKKCSKRVSKPETYWLNSLYVVEENRQIKLPNLGKIVVDGYDPTTNTVYEFYGDYWHGNPIKYDHNKINPVTKKTYGKLYGKTLEKEKIIKEAGYNLITIWESDFYNLYKENKMSLKKLVEEKNFSVYFTDKFSGHNFLDTYCELFDPLKYSVKNVLEVGIQKGGSVLLWKDHFENAHIYGVDIDLKQLTMDPLKEDRISVIEGNAYDPYFVKNVLPQIKYDVICEDGSHLIQDLMFFIKNYHTYLADGGIMVIEDIAVLEHAYQLKNALPTELQSKAKVVDLRHIANRWDDILLVLKK